MKYLQLLILALALTSISCTKDEEDDPQPATEEISLNQSLVGEYVGILYRLDSSLQCNGSMCLSCTSSTYYDTSAVSVELRDLGNGNMEFRFLNTNYTDFQFLLDTNLTSLATAIQDKGQYLDQAIALNRYSIEISETNSDTLIWAKLEAGNGSACYRGSSYYSQAITNIYLNKQP